MQLAASAFHRLTSNTTMSPIAPLFSHGCFIAWRPGKEPEKRNTLSSDLESTLGKEKKRESFE